jgi:hypothetical protein
VTIKTYKELQAAVEAGTISFDEASGKWIGAEEKKQNALDETLNMAKDHATQMSVVQDELVDLLTKTADTMIAKIKERAAQGELTESEAAKQIVAINKDKYEQILAIAEERLATVKDLYGEDSRAYKTTAEEVEEIANDLKSYKIKAMQDVTSALKSELNEQLGLEQSLKDELSSLRDKLVSDQESRADEIRAIRQKSMTDAEEQADLEAQANEKILAAVDALKEGNFERAEDLAKQAKGIAGSLDDEEKAVGLVGKAWDVIEDSTKTQESNKRAELDKTISKINELKAEIDEIDRNVDIDFTANGISEANGKIKDLVASIAKLKDKTITITQKIKTVEVSSDSNSSVEAKTGKRIDGYGGGDIVPALLEPGEWVIRKEAVKKYGDGFLARLNAGMIGRLPGFKTGGKVSGGEWNEKLQEYESLMSKVRAFTAYIAQATGMNLDTMRLTYANSNYPKMSTFNTVMNYAKYNVDRYLGINEDYLQNAENAMAKLTELGSADDYADAKEAYYQTVRADSMRRGHILSRNEVEYARLLASTFSTSPVTGGSSGGNSTSIAQIGASIKKFATGGKVSIPNIPSIPSIPSASGVGGNASKTVNHSVSLSINGNSVGPLTGDRATIGDFISQLKKAQRVT